MDDVTLTPREAAAGPICPLRGVPCAGPPPEGGFALARFVTAALEVVGAPQHTPDMSRDIVLLRVLGDVWAAAAREALSVRRWVDEWYATFAPSAEGNGE